MSAIVEFKNISKAFFGINALCDVSFSLEQGQAVGLVGENGAGKSTLMNILGGNLAPDSGEMLLNGTRYTPKNPGDATAAGVAFIHQELNLFTNLSIMDNIFIDRFPTARFAPFIRKKKMEKAARDVLASLKLNLSPHDLVEKLPPGERQMVEIAKALGTGADIIIFDEPTTSLTSRETEQLFAIIDQLKAAGKSIIYISHILPDVRCLCENIVVLRDGRLVDSGSPDLLDINRLIASMCGRELEQLFPERKTLPVGEVLLRVEKLSQNGVVKNINLELHEGEVLGLFGLMGAGRTELARILFGLDAFASGSFTISDEKIDKPAAFAGLRHSMAFVTENRREEGLLMDASIQENLALVSLREFQTRMAVLDQKKMRAAIGASATALKIKSNSFVTPVKNLSGGNQQKVVIGKWLLANPDIFILDEPTRGIDVGAKFEVYSIINDLAARGAGILFISSELEELLGMCDRILVLRNGEITGEFTKSQFDEQQLLRAAFGEPAKNN